jgi:flagellar FliL protein
MAEKEQDGGSEQKKAGGGKKLGLIIGLVLAIAGGGAGAYFYLDHAKAGAVEDKHAAVEVAKEEVGPPTVVPLEIFTANLQPADSEKYLQFALALTFSGGKGGEGEGGEALKPYISGIRDAVIVQIAELKPEDVTGNAARERLRSSIKAAIKEKLPSEERKAFKDVLFTQFVVQ